MNRTIAAAAGLCLAGISAFAAGEKLFTEPPSASLAKMKEFRIDGEFSEEEMKNSAGMFGFCRLMPNLDMMQFFDPESRFQIGTDGKSLYLGIQCETGKGGILERARKGRGGMKAFMDDSFEFVIVPHPDSKMPDIYHVIVNNKGSYMSEARIRGANAAWDPVFESKGVVKDGRWTYEIAFPLSQFGIADWKDGGTLGLRICRNWHSLAKEFGEWGVQSCWSQIRGAFFESDNIPRATLRENGPVVRFLSLVSEGKPDVKVSVYNPSAAPVKVKTVWFLKPDRSQSVSDESEAALAPGETKILTLPVAQLSENETASAAFRVLNPDGAVLYHRAFRWKKEKADVFEKEASEAEKLSLKYAFYAETGRLFLQLDASAVPNADSIKVLKAEVAGKTGGKVAETVLKPFRSSVSETLWQLPSLKKFTEEKNPSGEYTLTVTVGSDKLTRTFERKVFGWEGNSLGMSDRLIPPFTPVAVNGNEVSMILRTHELADTGLWKQVKADGETLFVDGGMKLVAEAGGKTYTVKGSGVKFTKKSGTAAEGSASWSVPGVISGKTDFRFEYDGMMKFNLTVNAGSKADSFRLVVPLDEKNAYLFHESADGLRFNYGGATPVKWDSSQAARTDLQTSFVPYLWLGTEGRGFSVYGENDRGWTVAEKVPAQTIRRGNGKVELVFNLFAKPVKLEQLRTITLAFQATPVKPMIKNWRKHQASWGLDGRIHPYTDYAITFYGSSLCEGGISASDDLLPRGNDLSLWKMYSQIRKTHKIPEGFLDQWLAGYPKDSPNKLETYRAEINYGLYTAMNAKPDSVTFYTNARGQRIDIPEARTFLDNWFREEFQGSRGRAPAFGASKAYSVDPTSSYRDFAMTCYKKMLETGACDNIYWDDVFLASNYDRSGSEPVYYSEDGKLQPSLGLFNLRELIRRTAVLQLELGRKPNNMVHITNAAMPPICAFAQQNLDWEDNLGTNPFQQRYTKEYIRAVSIGRQFGNLPAALGLVNGNGGKAAVEWCFRTGAGVALTHEIQWIRGGQSKGYCNVLLKFYQFGYGDDSRVKVRDYWEKDYPVTVTGGDTSSILLEKGKEAYLVVCSYCDDSSFTAGIRGMNLVSAVNGETGMPLEISGNKVNFQLKKYDFIFIKVKGN